MLLKSASIHLKNAAFWDYFPLYLSFTLSLSPLLPFSLLSSPPLLSRFLSSPFLSLSLDGFFLNVCLLSTPYCQSTKSLARWQEGHIQAELHTLLIVIVDNFNFVLLFKRGGGESFVLPGQQCPGVHLQQTICQFLAEHLAWANSFISAIHVSVWVWVQLGVCVCLCVWCCVCLCVVCVQSRVARFGLFEAKKWQIWPFLYQLAWTFFRIY